MEEHYEWLNLFAGEVETIANFGCWGSDEPFALLWTLDATEIAVIEKKKENLNKPKERWKFLRQQVPDSSAGRLVKFIVADMTTEIPGLQADYFDLAYCQDVLYQMEKEEGRQSVQNAIARMAKCVKPGGLVIAKECRLGVEFEDVGSGGFFEVGLAPRNAPINISPLFEVEGLSKIELNDQDYWVYCYRKS